MPPHPTRGRFNSGLPGSAGTPRGGAFYGTRAKEPVRRLLVFHPLCSEARRAALSAPASAPAGGSGKVAVGGSTPNVRSVLPPSIAEGGVRGAEVPPSLQDTENAK